MEIRKRRENCLKNRVEKEITYRNVDVINGKKWGYVFKYIRGKEVEAVVTKYNSTERNPA